MSAEPASTGGDGARNRTDRPRSMARLAAVQAIYEMDMAGVTADPVLEEFIEDRWRHATGDAADERLVEPDAALLAELVRGVGGRCADLDSLIEPTLDGEWTVQRLEAVLRAILRAATYELQVSVNVPSKVVINEYVNVANAFFTGNETSLVNGVLDRLARTLRPGELENSKNGEDAEDR